MTYHVYAIENSVNGKLYVGQTRNPRTRMKQHLTSQMLSGDVSEHGRHAFSMGIVATYDNLRDALRCETMLILAMDACNPLRGYNKIARVTREIDTSARLRPLATNAPACMSVALRDSLAGVRFKQW